MIEHWIKRVVCAGALLLIFAGTPRAAAVSADALCGAYVGLAGGNGSTAGMVRIAGGTFTMGSDEERPDERAASPERKWV